MEEQKHPEQVGEERKPLPQYEAEMGSEQSLSTPTGGDKDIVEGETPQEGKEEISHDLCIKLSRIEEQLAEMQCLFKEKIADDEVKGKLFEKLYLDLERYRDDFLFRYTLKKLFKDLIALFDRIDGLLQYAENNQLALEDIIYHIKSFRSELLEIMRKQGMSLIESKTEKFDDRYQEAIDIEPVSTAEEDLKVVRVVRRGFLYEDQVFRPEEVIVGKHRKGEDPNG